MKRKHLTPYLIIIISFLITILVGACLLALPIAAQNQKSMGFVNALFMSTSSVCVTGLSVYTDVGTSLSLFGKIIMMCLIELGGLSFLTVMTFVFYLIGKKIGISQRFLMKEALNQKTTAGILKLVSRTVLIAFIIQSIGTIINLFIFIPDFGVGKGIFVSLFHAISAFNNAGFDILEQGNSLMNYSSHILLNLNTMVLIILGGIGFIVILDICTFRRHKKLALHTKIVLGMTIGLILGGAILLKISMPELTWLESFFQSVTARTAGFSSIDMTEINNPASLILMILMFIGAAPCSTGGGIKVTTFFVVIIYMAYFARGKKAKIGYRRIAEKSVFKAFVLITFSLMYIFIAIFFISMFEKNINILAITFEVVSGFATVGLSMSLTPLLSIGSKLVLCLTMFIGRLGPLTIISLMNKNWTKEGKEEIGYIEESIIVG